ncbi:MAG: hypothetical protein RLZZ179_3273 [Verrucomicrobiota bacterium]|jgi:hypothetical protein
MECVYSLGVRIRMSPPRFTAVKPRVAELVGLVSGERLA